MADLTADDIHRIAFRKPPLGKRGYDEQEVDAFLDEIERTLAGLYARLGPAAPSPAPVTDARTDGVTDAMAAELADIKATLARIEARLNTSGSTAAGGAFF
jgi:DivIVA domain-containing protein